MNEKIKCYCCKALFDKKDKVKHFGVNSGGTLANVCIKCREQLKKERKKKGVTFNPRIKKGTQ